MISKTKYIALATGVLLLAGCATTNPIGDVVSSLGVGNALTTAGEKEPISVDPVVLKIPNDNGIQKRPQESYSTVIVRDIGYDSVSVTVTPNARYLRLLHESLTPTSLVVHARTDNGMAGSGVRYEVQYSVQDSPTGYAVKFLPVSRSTYQQGLIGKFPVPDFGERDLRSHLSSLQIVYRFEVDSPFNSESVTANFMRSAETKSLRQGWRDPVTGKVYNTQYVSKLRNRDLVYNVQVYPYRNGSKAVINAIVPGVETSANTVDFGVLINEARQLLEGIARS